MSLTVTDLFCGAGGSSTGAVAVPGVTVRMAANHWQLAIDTHNTNHPATDHDCADLSQVDPRRYPRTDILWASPECTNHSQAKGRRRNADHIPDLFGDALPDEAAQRSRATMWDVPRFAEHHHYAAIIVENVVDAAKWILWPAWWHAMECLGYEGQTVWLNSMHAQQMGLPAPQSRDRLYVVWWRKGARKPDLDRWTRPAAWCRSCEQVVSAVQVFKRPDRRWGRYRQQYVYRCPTIACRGLQVEPDWLPAAYAIDWTLPGERIGDRARPLAEKTRARIEAGLRRYARPIHLEAAGNTFHAATRGGSYWRAWPVDDPLATMHTTASKAIAYDGAMLVPVEGRDGKQALLVRDPMRTQTARNETAVCRPPFLLDRRFEYRIRELSEPLSTVTAEDTTKALVVPLRTHGTATPADEPLKTVVAGTVSQALVVPLRNHNTVKGTDQPLDTVAAAGNHHALLVPYYGHATPRTTDDPHGTLTTKDRYALVMRNNTARGDQGQMSTPVGEELRTITTAGHQSLIEWDVPDVDDCLFRMLEPHEIKAAMAFDTGYQLLGNKREQVRLAGNAVTPPAARDLFAAVAESLGQEVA